MKPLNVAASSRRQWRLSWCLEGGGSCHPRPELRPFRPKLGRDRDRESGFFLDFFLFSTDRRILPAQTSPHRQPGPAPGLRQPVHTTHCTRMQAPATFDIPETTRPEGEPTSTSLLRPMPTDAVTPLTPRTRLHAGWDDGSTPVPGYRRCPVHDTPLASARGRCLVVVGRRLHALGLLWVHLVTRSNNRASTRWYSSPPVRWSRHTAPRCTPLSRHNERDTTQRTPSRTRGEGAGSTRLRNGACRAPNEWKPYRVHKEGWG